MGFKVYPLVETANSGTLSVDPISLHDAALQTAGKASTSSYAEAGSPKDVAEVVQGLTQEGTRSNNDLHESAYAFCWSSS